MKQRGPVIAIDGPAAAGKGTLARRLAEALGLKYLDTGLLYRAVGRRVLDVGGDPADADAAAAAARALRQEDLRRGDLRGPEADAAAAAVAAIPAVRAALLDFQRDFPGKHGAVLDGRDIGRVIFPDARVKLYVTASLNARAQRRWQELVAKGAAPDLEMVRAEMHARDTRDAPNMIAADDAIEVDTTELDADEVFAGALRLVREKLGERSMGKKIDIAALKAVVGTLYPPPFDEPCRARERRRLGDAAGLTQYGVNLLRLPPGAWSSQRHWHAKEDEFVYVVSGEVVLVTDAGDEVLRAGDCAGFKAGDSNGHCLQNRGTADATVLEIGSRIAGEYAVYSDIDMKTEPGGGYVHKDGTLYPKGTRRGPG